MEENRPRINRERKTVEAMVRIFCRDRHGAGRGLCLECGELLSYSSGRLEQCPFGNEKPACSHCPIHCYRPDMRERIRTVMRYAGPRMIWRHPILAACHLLDGRRQATAAPAPKDRAGK